MRRVRCVSGARLRCAMKRKEAKRPFDLMGFWWALQDLNL